MTISDSQIGISGGLDGSPPLMNGSSLLVQRVQHQLHADEGEDDRQAVGEVDQPLEQAADQEVQLAQAHQREGVGGEDDVRLLGEAEDRRDRVEREQQVGGADRDASRRASA